MGVSMGAWGEKYPPYDMCSSLTNYYNFILLVSWAPIRKRVLRFKVRYLLLARKSTILLELAVNVPLFGKYAGDAHRAKTSAHGHTQLRHRGERRLVLSLLNATSAYPDIITI